MNNLVLVGIVLFLGVLLYKKIEVAKVNVIAFFCAIFYSSTFLLDSYVTKSLELYGEVFKCMVIVVIIIGILTNVSIVAREWNEDSVYKRGVLYLVITTAIGSLIALTIGDLTKIGVTIIPFSFNGAYFIVGLLIIVALIFKFRKEELYGVKKVVPLIQKVIPLAVFISTSLIIEINGFNALAPIIILLVIIVITCLIQVFIVHGAFVLIVKKENPITYFLSIKKALFFAFKSRSSGETAPVLAKEVMKTSNLSSSIVSHYTNQFVKVGMNACNGIYPACIGLLGLHLYGKEITAINMIIILVSVIIASVVLKNMPGVASVSSAFVLIALGLPMDSLFICLGIDYVIDKIRTTTNIASVAVSIKIL